MQYQFIFDQLYHNIIHKRIIFSNLKHILLDPSISSEIIAGSLLGNLRETSGIRHFVATRSVKRSEASSLASGVCRLPFRHPLGPSSRRPSAQAAASLTPVPPGHPFGLTECAIARPIPRAAPCHSESSRATSRPIPSSFYPLACRHEPPLCAHGRA